MRQKMVIRAFRQSGRPEQVPELMSQPRQHGDDHRSVPVADLHASRASTFSRYATLALRYAFSSSRSCSLVGAGLGLDFAPLGLPFGFGRSASGPPDRYSRHQRSNGVRLAILYFSMTSAFVSPCSTWSRTAASFVS
ncbi:Transposase [Bifidobacterium breve JCM 7019]|nr:Transposase [Bifidobacterium breve JCM 7019]